MINFYFSNITWDELFPYIVSIYAYKLEVIWLKKLVKINN